MSGTDIPVPIEVVEANEELAELWDWCVRDEYLCGRMDADTAKECSAAVGTVQARAEADRIKWEIANRVAREAEFRGDSHD